MRPTLLTLDSKESDSFESPCSSALNDSSSLHGKTYKEVATHLQLSEASVKRMFSEKSFTLQRLDEICGMMEIELSDLVQQMRDANNSALTTLTLEQEQEIVADIKLLLITVCVLQRWSMAEILEYYHISESECLLRLGRLDQLKLIELLPGNRIKLRIAPNFTWHKSGPIQQFFKQHIESEFFHSRFNHQNEKLITLNGMLSHNAHQVFQRKMDRLAQEFEQLNGEDANLPVSERHGVTLVVATRRWDYGLFAPYRKGVNHQ